MNSKPNPDDLQKLFAILKNEGKVPDTPKPNISKTQAVFMDMYLDLGEIMTTILKTNNQPTVVFVYADTLYIQNSVSVGNVGVMVYARQVIVGNSADILLDYSTTNKGGGFALVSDKVIGTLQVIARISDNDNVKFSITKPMTSDGIAITWGNGKPISENIKKGVANNPQEQLALNNSFIYGSLLCDTNPSPTIVNAAESAGITTMNLALDIMTWIKYLSAESADLLGLYLRSSSLVVLLSSQISAKENGAVFVPYLTSTIYTELAQSFVKEATDYETNYLALERTKALEDNDIEAANNMLKQAQINSAYIKGQEKQAQTNYTNAVKAVEAAQNNFLVQKLNVNDIGSGFTEIGIPDYELEVTFTAIGKLFRAIVTFGGAIALMAVGQEEAAPAAAAEAVEGVEAVETIAEAAENASQFAQLAKELGDVMKSLKSLIDGLQKLYTFTQAVIETAGTISSVTSMADKMKNMDINTNSTDLSDTGQWEIFRLKIEQALQFPIDAKIKYAKAYKESMDILAVYGQSLASAQLAAIRTGQEYLKIQLQQHFAEQQQNQLETFVKNLKKKENAPTAMMQQFYMRYLDVKSSLFSELENYRASYFYWALIPSIVHPTIMDKVSGINSGLSDMSKITFDKAEALKLFSHQFQDFFPNVNYDVVVPEFAVSTDVTVITPNKTKIVDGVIKKLRANRTATWTLPIDSSIFLGDDRVRLNTIRVWLQGVIPEEEQMISVDITTSGNYRDTLKGKHYQFTGHPIFRRFQYFVNSTKYKSDFLFDDGKYGHIHEDGRLDDEISYAYFKPTPFTDWTITLNPSLDLKNLSKITMQFGGINIPGKMFI